MNFDLLDDDAFEALFGITRDEYDMLMQMDFSNLPADFDYSTYKWEEVDEAKLPKNFDWTKLSDDDLEEIDWDLFYDREWQMEQEPAMNNFAKFFGWYQIVGAQPDIY